MTLATPHQQRHNPLVPFNHGTGLGGPNSKADSRLAAIFMSVRNTIGAPSTVGRGGGVLARAGSLLPVRQPCHAPTTLLGGWVMGLTLSKETCTMSSIALRAIRALFPVFSVPVSTVPTHAQACAMARLLVSQGKRVAVAPAARGFIVSEVKA